MQFQLITAGGVQFDEPVYEVLVPTKDGTVALFADHMPLISAGSPGVLSIRKKPADRDEAMEHFAVYGGIIQIDGKTARFVTDDITTPAEVSEQEARKALERAEELVATAPNREALREAKEVLEVHTARLHLARLKSRHHR